MQELSGQLESILELTRSMQDAAKENDWEAVAKTERDRLPLLEALFETPHTEQDAERIRLTIEEIIAIDGGILNGAEAEKNTIHSKYKQLSLEKRAFEEYAKNR